MKKLTASDISKMSDSEKNALLLLNNNTLFELQKQLSDITKRCEVLSKEMAVMKNDRIINQKTIRTMKANIHTQQINFQHLESMVRGMMK